MNWCTWWIVKSKPEKHFYAANKRKQKPFLHFAVVNVMWLVDLASMQCDIRIRFNDAWISLRFNHTARAQCARTHRIDGIRGGLFLSHRLLWKIEWSHFECNIVICHSIFIIISIIPFSNGVIIIKFVLFFFLFEKKKKRTKKRSEAKFQNEMKQKESWFVFENMFGVLIRC